MLVALRPGGFYVMHSLQSGQVPSMSPSLLMYQQISLHGFNLSQWVEDNGTEAYVSMLKNLSELVKSDKLALFTRSLSVDDLNPETLKTALKSHRAVQDGVTTRERTVLVFGDEASANEVYFELQASLGSHLSISEEELAAPPTKPIAPG